jgi:streptogramin lyase
VSAIDVGGGAVWIAYSDGSLARLDAQTEKVTNIMLPEPAQDIVAGDDALWVSTVHGTVFSVRYRSLEIGRDTKLGGTPGELTVGGGKVWIASPSEGTIAVLDERSGDPRRTIPIGTEPISIVYADGSVWIGDGTDGTIRQLDAESEELIRETAIGNPIEAIGVDEATGSVWAWIGSGGPGSAPA